MNNKAFDKHCEEIITLVKQNSSSLKAAVADH
jgi:hypothetical protein